MTLTIPPTMGDPALYSIRVGGRLPCTYSPRLEGMKISVDLTARGSEETVLLGWLRDQAALFGVLNTLYELRMPIVSARCLDRRKHRNGERLDNQSNREDRVQ